MFKVCRASIKSSFQICHELCICVAWLVTGRQWTIDGCPTDATRSTILLVQNNPFCGEEKGQRHRMQCIFITYVNVDANGIRNQTFEQFKQKSRERKKHHYEYVRQVRMCTVTYQHVSRTSTMFDEYQRSVCAIYPQLILHASGTGPVDTAKGEKTHIFLLHYFWFLLIVLIMISVMFIQNTACILIQTYIKSSKMRFYFCPEFIINTSPNGN